MISVEPPTCPHEPSVRRFITRRASMNASVTARETDAARVRAHVRCTMAFMPSWPPWWNYELVISPHVIERMQERNITEIDLRAMLADAAEYRPSVVTGRFIIETRHNRQPWEVVVEPDDDDRVLVVVTAYGVQ
jgi:hypothetical protein